MRKRNRQFNIRFTDEELYKLRVNASKVKMSVSNYVRSLLNGNSPKECPPLEYHKLMGELQNCVCALNELKDIIHFHIENTGGNLTEFESEFRSELEQTIREEISEFSNILLDIHKAVQLPDKVKL